MNGTIVKSNVSYTEYLLQRMAHNVPGVNVPVVYEYQAHSFGELGTLVMRRIHGMNLSDKYGEEADRVPAKIMDKVRAMVAALYAAGIEYVDITGYNFIEDRDGVVWIVDFGHARCLGGGHGCDFVGDFMAGAQGWNPDFR